MSPKLIHFLSSFFMHIGKFKVKFNDEFWNLHLDLCFARFKCKKKKKKQKPARKAKKMAKAGNIVMLRHNYNSVATKSQGNLQKFVA